MKRRQFCHSVAGLALGGGLAMRAWPTVYAGLLKVDRDVDAVSTAGRELNLSQASVQSLADSLRGPLLLPGNAAYDTARQVLNPVIDKHPAMVVQPTGSADVSTAVHFARANDLVVAVKCGGHSYAGKSTCNGGVLIDLSRFRDVRVDSQRQSAFVTGGSLLGQLDHESMARGLVTTAGTVSHTGVGGLATGGGFGRLARQHGLALDNIVGVDIVTGDGQVRHASSDENPELLWGVRGGGGNFGVVTSFEFQLHPMQRKVIGGTLVFPGSLARELLETYAESSLDAPDELYTDLVIVRPPDGSPGVALIDVCYTGSASEAERLLKPYRAIGKPLRDGIGAVDYVALQRSGDNSDPRARASYMKGGFISEFKPGLIDDLLNGLQASPERSAMIIFQQAGGAISRVPVEATAFPHRYASHNMMALVGWKPELPMEPHANYIRNYWKTLAPYTHGFYTVEADDESSNAFNRNYQANYPRLVALKNRYDPRNLFRLNANIQPTA
jgi:hypothetical protein